MAPTFGGSKKTTSPIESWAYQVIPKMVASGVSPSIARPVVLGVVEQVVGIAGVGHGSGLLACRWAWATTTAATLRLPRTSISNRESPAWARAAGRNAIPIPRSRLGEKVPLVTTPPPSTGLPWRGIPWPSIVNELRVARNKHFVDYTRVAMLKAPALKLCFAGLSGDRTAKFAQFVTDRRRRAQALRPT